MASVLFTLVKSPFELNELQIMDQLAGSNKKGVLLFEDAVYYATVEQNRKELLSKGYSIYAINEELEARGFANFSKKGIELIDYSKAIDLIMERYDKVVSL